MRRIESASASRLTSRLYTLAGAVTVSIAVLLDTPGLAVAQPDSASPDTVAGLIADVANANQQLQDLGAAVQTQQESVNKALVDVQTARDNAAAAQQDVDASEQGVKDADAAIAAAQQRFDTFAAATYTSGPSASFLEAASPEDVLDTAVASQTLAASSAQVLDGLQRARTEQVNKESLARLAKQKADQAAIDAQTSQDAAVAALTGAQQQFGQQQAELDSAAAARRQAEARLDAAVGWSPQAAGQSPPPPAGAPVTAHRWDADAQLPAGLPDADPPDAAPPDPAPPADAGQWDNTLPMVPSANVPDPVAVVNSVLAISASSAQVTADMGRNFLQMMGIISPSDSGINNGAIPRVYGRQASEYVIRRAESQIGVPYSWGGGTPSGPSRGIDSGAGTVGFDCSGLMVYAFAGVGIKLPHYSGSQYTSGRQVPAAEARRGDLIFYGPNASQHVALYLGDGNMLEAPFTGSTVHISPVRTSGMTPYVTRLIEY